MTINDFTVKQYQAFKKVDEPTEEDLITAFLSNDKKKVREMPLEDVERFLNDAKTALNSEPVFFPTFKLAGKEFGFIPNLDSITYGENTDLTSYMGDYETLHKAMAVAYRPVTKKFNGQYQIEPYEGAAKYADLMKDAPLGVALGMGVFFYNLTNDLLNCIPSYLEEMAKNQLSLGKSGEHISSYTRSLKVMLDASTKLRNSLCTNAIFT